MCSFPRYTPDTGVPYKCGTCPECLVMRTDAWIFRILQEECRSHSSMWIRLSYDNEHLPLTAHGFPTLDIRDCQLFFKRLRKAHEHKPTFSLRWHDATKDFVYNRRSVNPWPIKYYLCGEYGSLHSRPHYHVLLLNCQEKHLYSSWRDDDGCPIGDIYIAPDVVNSSNIGYTVGYMNKTRSVFNHGRDDRVREFALMSKRMGLSYLTPEMIDWHLADYSRRYITLPNGKRSALPRYFADRLYTDVYDVQHRVPISDLTEPDMVRSKSAAFQRAYLSHVQLYGNGDDFIRSQNEARHAAVRNFQAKFNSRSDV